MYTRTLLKPLFLLLLASSLLCPGAARAQDTSAPTTTAAPAGMAGANGWYTGPVAVTLSAADPDGVADVEGTFYTLDAGAAQAYTVPVAVSGDGTHALTYWSVDQAGNTEAVNTLAVPVDATAPATTAKAAASAGLTTVTLSAADATSGVAATCYTLDGSAAQTYATTVAVTGGGGHSLTYWSVDVAGNVEAVNTLAVGVDTSAPTTTASPAGPAGANGWYTGPVAVTLSAADPDGAADVAGTFYTLDGGAAQSYSAPAAILGDGTHSLTFWSVDVAGNVEAVNTLAVLIDGTAPATTAAVSAQKSGGRIVTLTASDATSGVAATYYTLDGGAAQVYATSAAVMGGGGHSLTYWSVDVAGNAEAANALTVPIDGTAPTTTASPVGPTGANGWYTGPVAVTLSATDPDGPSDVAATYYTLDGGAAQAYAAPVAVSGDGTHTLTYWSVDQAGNVEGTHALAVSIDGAAPTTAAAVAGFQNTAGAYRTSATMTLSATDKTSGVAATFYTLDGGTAQTYSAPFTVSTAGPHTLTYWSVDAAGNAEARHGLTLTVYVPGLARVTVTTSRSPSVFGTPITFTAVVRAAVGSAVPTGAVTFTDGMTALGTVALTAGKAILTIPALAVGVHALTITYGGDTAFGPASGALSQTVTPAVARLALASSRTPSVYGTAVTFTASVSSGSSGAGVPTGAVTFTDAGVVLGTVALSAGRAAVTLPTPSVGSHPIVAAYGGDAAFGPASAALTQTVTAAVARVTVSTSRSPSVLGQAVTFTVAVASATTGVSNPTGTVTFTDAGAALGTVTLSAGRASLTVSSLAIGTHPITAAYGGNAAFGPASGALTQIVRGLSVTTVVSSLSPSIYGQSVSLTASVSSATVGAPTPTGTVTFQDGTVTLGTVTLSGGQAVWMGTGLNAGTHTVKVTYNGDGITSPSAYQIIQIVFQSATATSLSVPAASFGAGQPAALAVSVTAVAPGVGTPTGSVTFLDEGVSLGTAPLNGGQASLAVPGLSANDLVTAVYAGDKNFLGSASAPAGSAPQSRGVRIMPLGDSITYGHSQDPTVQGGYRGPLWEMTTAQGWQCQYVGSQVFGPPGIGGCEGHPGWGIPSITQIVPQVIPQYQPDVILLQIGTNSLHVASDLPTALASMSTLLDTLIRYAPNAQVVVASVTPTPSASLDALFQSFNQQLPGMVQVRAAKGARISFVDMHSLCGFVPSDYSDSLHPTSSGYAKMANVWYNVLSGLPIPR